MQNVATDKSQIAALPLKHDLTNRQAGSNELFRSFLTSAEPVYHHPVEPRAPHTNRSIEPNNSNQARKNDSPSKRETPRAAHEHSDKRAQTNSSSVEGDNSQNVSQRKPAQSGANNQNKADDVKPLASTNSSENKQLDTENSAKQDGIHKQEKTVASADKSSTEASKDKDATVMNEGAKQTVVDTKDNQKAASEVDWLALVEKSQKVSFDKLSPEEQLKQLTNSDDAQEQLVRLSELTEDTSNQLDPELLALLDKLKELVGGGQAELSNTTEGDIDKQMALLLEQQEQLDNDVSSEANSQITESDTLSTENPELDKTLLALLELIQRKGQSPEQQVDIDEQLSQFGLTMQNGDLEALHSEIEQIAESQTIDPEDIALLKQMLNDAMTSEDIDGNTDLALEQQLQSANIDQSVKNLLRLPDEQLDKAIANLANRLFPQLLQDGSTKVPSEKGVADNSLVDVAAQRKDFVANLKVALEEVKSQLQQGHQSGIDLNALVAQSMQTLKDVDVRIDRIAQVSQQFSSALELAGQLNKMSDSSLVSASLERISNREQHSGSTIATKQVQQQMQQFDKAVNITRSEGHQQFVEKVRWMVNQNNLQADIRLDPPDLGSMKVRVSLSGESASVNIVVQSQQARDALEQAAPKLRELLEQQGIELGQSSVEQEQNQTAQQQSSQGSVVGAGSNVEGLDEPDGQVIEQQIRAGRPGGIDYFV